MKKKSNVFLKIAICVLLVFSVITVITVRKNFNDLEKQKAELQSKIDEYSEEVEKIKYDLSLPREEYIEKYGREVLGLHKNGEIIFRNVTK